MTSLKNLLLTGIGVASLALTGCGDKEETKEIKEKLKEYTYVGDILNKYVNFVDTSNKIEPYTFKIWDNHTANDFVWLSSKENIFNEKDCVEIKYLSNSTIKSYKIIKTAEEREKERMQSFFNSFEGAIFENGKLVRGHLKNGPGIIEGNGMMKELERRAIVNKYLNKK